MVDDAVENVVNIVVVTCKLCKRPDYPFWIVVI